MDELTELKNKRIENYDQIERLQKENEEITDKIFRIGWGLYKGAIVVDKEGNKYQVAKIKEILYGKPWVRAYPFKKNGDVSKFLRHLFGDWELVKE